MTVKIFQIALLMLFVSCGSSIRNNEITSIMIIPNQWSVEFTGRDAGGTAWWEEFNDAGLEEILNEAYRNNYSLKIASSNILSAVAQARIAGAPLLPQTSLSYNNQRNKQNFIGFPIPGSEGRVLSTTNTSFGVSLNISWEADLWGKLKAGEANAVANMQIAEADLRGAKLSLEAQVSKAWFASIEAKKQVELSKRTFENLKISTGQIRARYESGLRNSLDLRLALSNLAINEANLKQREIQYDNVIRQLEILLGRYPSAELEIGDSLPVLNQNVPGGLPADIISRRPDLVSAERLLAASNAGIKSAKGALYPQISLTASSGSSSREIADLLSGDFGIWSLGAGLLQPVFQRGRLKAGVELAEQTSEMALSRYAQSVLNAFAEVENALANEHYLGERETLIASAMEQSLAAKSLSEEQYLSGLTDFITMLEAQRSAYENESQLLTTRRQRLDARIDLHMALGGSFNYETEIYDDLNGVKKK